MKKNSDEFIKKIIDRSYDPVSQLKKIQNMVPMFFAGPNIADTINKHFGNGEINNS